MFLGKSYPVPVLAPDWWPDCDGWSGQHPPVEQHVGPCRPAHDAAQTGEEQGDGRLVCQDPQVRGCTCACYGFLCVSCCFKCFCTGHFVMVPLNLICLHCLQHFSFEYLFNLYWLYMLSSLFPLDLLCRLVICWWKWNVYNMPWHKTFFLSLYFFLPNYACTSTDIFLVALNSYIIVIIREKAFLNKNLIDT